MTITEGKLSPFLATSAALHAGLFLLVVFGPSLFPARATVNWGTNSGDTQIRVGVATSLPGIPLPSPAVVRDDAKGNESKTLNPKEPSRKPTALPEKAGIKIPSKNAKPAKPDPAPRTARVEPEPPPVSPNAIPGAGGQVALPFGQNGSGSGPATFGGDGSFGNRFPAYVTAMTQAISSQWRDTIAGIARGRAPRVYVTFTINRDGAVHEVQVDQSSGNSQLDASARRAVLSAMLPPLPRDYRGSTVDVRFYFEYAR